MPSMPKMFSTIQRICKDQKLYLDGLGMDKSEREIYYEYRAIKEKEICQECPICLSTILVLKKEEVKKNIKY